MSGMNVRLTQVLFITGGNQLRLDRVCSRYGHCGALHCDFYFLASGVLKGFDPLLNLVLDGTIEYMRGKANLFFLQ